MSIPERLGLRSVDLENHRLRLRRAWPRGGRRLLAEFVDEGGQLWAGQWYGDDNDRSRLDRIRRHTAAVSPGCDVEVLEGLGLVVQAGGADRKLVDLADVVGVAGNTLVTHRAERRAVVRLAGGEAYMKVVEPAKVPGLIRCGQAASALGMLSAPRLLWAHPSKGVATWEALPGRTLHGLGDEAPTEAWAALGSQLRALHNTPAPPDLPTHGWREETRVIETWFHRFSAFEPRQAAGLSTTVTRIMAALEDDAAGHVLIHRDLHDKQVLWDDQGRLYWLDFDTLSVGDPALDLANLLVHIDLRVAQGTLAAATACDAAAAVVGAYRPTATVGRRVGAYAAATVLRLHFLYSFRSIPLTAEWLTSASPSIRLLT